VLAVVVFLYGPIIASALLSVLDWNLLSSDINFVGVDNYTAMFGSADFQLSAWTEDETVWPQTRDLQTFREWFRIDIHSVVVDVAEDDIEGEEL
jgi:ABC-type sugar transport system permease subunit